jgi:hypothetical protein
MRGSAVCRSAIRNPFMSRLKGKLITCLDYFRSIDVRSYTNRRIEKCKTGGNVLYAVKRVASTKLSHVEQKYLCAM